MASPRLDNGYARIAVEIVEALCRTKIPSRASQILWAVFRETYGWGRSEWPISHSRFQELTGISRKKIPAILKSLEEQKLIKIDRTGHVNVIGFQKDYERWNEGNVPRGGDTLSPVEGTPGPRERGHPVPRGGDTLSPVEGTVTDCGVSPVEGTQMSPVEGTPPPIIERKNKDIYLETENEKEESSLEAKEKNDKTKPKRKVKRHSKKVSGEAGIYYGERYAQEYGFVPDYPKHWAALARKAQGEDTRADIRAIIDVFWADDYAIKQSHPLPLLVSKWNECKAKAVKRSAQRSDTRSVADWLG